MHADSLDIDAMIEECRAQGAGDLDPLRFARITALQRRASTQVGAARDRLTARLAALVDAYAQDLARRPPRTREKQDATSQARSTLGVLVETMHAQLEARGGAADALQPARYPELAALSEFQTLWSALRTDGQVRASLAEVPTGAGPLNSSALAHRALTLMGGLSPDYLRQFLAYVDTLSWLESLQDAGVLTGKDAPPPPGAKPRKPRTRKRG